MRWRMLVVVMLVAWMAAVAVWAFRPWPDSVPLVVPPEVDLQSGDARSVDFVCGAPLGNDTVAPSAEAAAPPHPLARRPCVDRGERRVVAVVDLVVGAVAVLVVVRLARAGGAPTSDPVAQAGRG
jgi:hypothetical protein